MSGIPEGVLAASRSAASMRCDNPEIVKTDHQAKVYSQAAVGSPPMSVPHLDTRVVEGKTRRCSALYGFTTKFLSVVRSSTCRCRSASTTSAPCWPWRATTRPDPLPDSQKLQSEEKRLKLARLLPRRPKPKTGALRSPDNAQIIKKHEKLASCSSAPNWWLHKMVLLAACWAHRQGASVTVRIMLDRSSAVSASR